VIKSESMDKLGTRRQLGLLFCILSFALLIWTQWPIKPVSREIVFQPGQLQMSSQSKSTQDFDAGGQSIAQAFPEKRTIKLEWTPIVRMGDTSQVKISIAANQDFRTENSVDNGDFPSTLTKFENVYDKYSIAAEARLALLEMGVIPSGISGQVLPEGQDITFIWKITPNSSGLYEGTTWLYLRFFPLLGGEIIEQAVSAQPLVIKVISLLGIKSNYWRIMGVLGLFIGFYLQKKTIIGFVSRIFRRKY